MKKTQGFTLIELLVVIAIIGILSSVVLASLNSARDKGEDAAVKANLSNMRAQAELTYDNVGNYSTVCTVSADAVTAADANCADSDDGWTATAVLSDDDGATTDADTDPDYFCVDNTGSASRVSAGVTDGADWTDAMECADL